MAIKAFRRSVGRRVESVMTRLGDALNFRYYYVPFNRYYWAVPERRALPEKLWQGYAEPPGVRMNEQAQVQLLAELRDAYRADYEAMPRKAPGNDHEFYHDNGNFGGIDAVLLYGLIRKYKPRRMIEVGSGHSTRLSAQALRANKAETGAEADFTAIEPHPRPFLRKGLPGLTRLIEKRIQDVPTSEFERLEANDILFIDSSHVLAIGSDVHYELLEVVPRVKPGVLVHFHDIHLPGEYPRSLVMENRFWTEQYILQAFLAFNDSFEVMWGANYMTLKHPGELEKALSFHRSSVDRPSSFWFRRVK